MSELFKLQSTYEMIIAFSTNTRPVPIEVFRSTENEKKLRARVWDQNTYNLYPTFANIPEEGGLENRLMSCDEVNREITTLLAEDPEMIYGKEWESEEQFITHIKDLISKYQATLNE